MIELTDENKIEKIEEILNNLNKLDGNFEDYKKVYKPEDSHIKKYLLPCYVYAIYTKEWCYIGMRASHSQDLEKDLRKYCSSSTKKDIILKDKDALNFRIIKIYDNIFEASLYESFIHSWFDVKHNDLFLNESNQTPYFISNKGSGVVKIDRNNKILKEYNSISEALKDRDNKHWEVSSPFKKQLDIGYRLIRKRDYEEIKEYYNYSDYIYNPFESPRNIKIIGVDIDTFKIETFISIQEAMRKYNNTSIGVALSKEDVLFANNKMWFEEEEYLSIENIEDFIKDYKIYKVKRRQRYHNIKAFKNGELYGTYDSITEAQKETGACDITFAIEHKDETCGFFFEADSIKQYISDMQERRQIYGEIRKRYKEKFGSLEGFWTALKRYEETPYFKANENIFEQGYYWDERMHFIMRWKTGIYLKKAMEAMKMEVDKDPNIAQDLKSGNIGSFQRIAKMWVGASTDDDSEMGSGRFMKPVRLATFPNTQNSPAVVWKRVSVNSSCSHHSAPFSTQFASDSYAIVGYIPDKFVLGISKLQRLTDFVCRRFWLQEDLTKALYNEVSKAAQTPDVFVGLYNVKHTCEWLRGSRNPEGGFTSEFWGGRFDNPELRNHNK